MARSNKATVAADSGTTTASDAPTPTEFPDDESPAFFTAEHDGKAYSVPVIPDDGKSRVLVWVPESGTVPGSSKAGYIDIAWATTAFPQASVDFLWSYGINRGHYDAAPRPESDDGTKPALNKQGAVTERTNALRAGTHRAGKGGGRKSEYDLELFHRVTTAYQKDMGVTATKAKDATRSNIESAFKSSVEVRLERTKATLDSDSPFQSVTLAAVFAHEWNQLTESVKLEILERSRANVTISDESLAAMLADMESEESSE